MHKKRCYYFGGGPLYPYPDQCCMLLYERQYTSLNIVSESIYSSVLLSGYRKNVGHVKKESRSSEKESRPSEIHVECNIA